MSAIQKRESVDGDNFVKFREVIRRDGTVEDVSNFDNDPDMKSPFLRAIMRTHTLEMEVTHTVIKWQLCTIFKTLIKKSKQYVLCMHFIYCPLSGIPTMTEK